MNKVKKVLMTMFGLLMFPLLFACSNAQSQGHSIIQKGLELDFLVTHNVWIWRAPCTVFR